MAWADEAHHEFQYFLTALTRFLDRYAVYLEPELVAGVEAILTSDMARFAAHFQNLIRQPTVMPALFADATAEPLIHQYIRAYNEVAAEERFRILPSNEVWRKDVLPAIGSAALAP